MPIESPDAIEPLKSAEKLKMKPEADNVLLEHRLALELHARGYLKIYPVFYRPDKVWTQPFKELPEEVHPPTEEKVKEHLKRLGYGPPRYTDPQDVNVRETWAKIMRIQSHFQRETEPAAQQTAECIRSCFVGCKSEGYEMLGAENIQAFNIAFIGSAGLGKTTLQRWMFKESESLWEAPFNTQIHQLELNFSQAEDEKQALERKKNTMMGADDSSELLRLEDEIKRLGAEAKRLEDQKKSVKNNVEERKKEIKDKLKRIEDLRGQRQQNRAKNHFSTDDDKKIHEAEAELAQLTNNFPGETTVPTVVVDPKRIGIIPAQDGDSPKPVKLDVTLIDTPGTGSVDISTKRSIEYVMTEINQRLKRHKEQAVDDSANLFERSNLIHLCLFMLPPTNRMCVGPPPCTLSPSRRRCCPCLCVRARWQSHRRSGAAQETA